MSRCLRRPRSPQEPQKESEQAPPVGAAIRRQHPVVITAAVSALTLVLAICPLAADVVYHFSADAMTCT